MSASSLVKRDAKCSEASCTLVALRGNGPTAEGLLFLSNNNVITAIFAICNNDNILPAMSTYLETFLVFRRMLHFRTTYGRVTRKRMHYFILFYILFWFYFVFFPVFFLPLILFSLLLCLCYALFDSPFLSHRSNYHRPSPSFWILSSARYLLESNLRN